MARSFFGGGRFELDGVEFVSDMGTSSSERFFVLKDDDQLATFMELCRRHAGGAIVELGIACGGSTALIALAARPGRLVAIELDPTPVAGLAELIRRRGLDEVVRPVYGVDQADRSRLAEVVDEAMGGAALDLVIDDASHLLSETTASFEVLFPRLRPGGTYVIEDWNSAHRFAAACGGTPLDGVSVEPLSPLLVRLLLLRAVSGDLVSRITIGDLWAAVERGPAELAVDDFRLADHVVDHFGLIPSDEGG